jgi:hypothetical protein
MEVINLGEVASENSFFKIFPSEDGEAPSGDFYVELRNDAHQFVDTLAQEIRVELKAKTIPFEMQKISQGKYLLSLFIQERESSELKIFIQGKLIPNLVPSLSRPSKKHSHMSVISYGQHSIRLRVSLKDRQGRVVDVEGGPEINLEGHGELGPLSTLSPGVWDFDLIYPEQDQIFYFSVRARGSYFRRFFRFQHIEK